MVDDVHELGLLTKLIVKPPQAYCVLVDGVVFDMFKLIVL